MNNLKTSYTYDDIGIKPIYKSTINSRENIDTSILLYSASSAVTPIKLDLPIIASPMESVVDTYFATECDKEGIVACLPRINLKENSLRIKALKDRKVKYIISIGATGDFLQEAKIYYEKGCRYFCVDIANGFSFIAEKALKQLRKEFGANIFIISGNVASLEGYKAMASWGADAVRVGIGNGSPCTTSLSTGVGIGQASLIREVAEFKKKNLNHSSLPMIIADGGIKTPADMSKAIALGADLVMAGGIFATTTDSAGSVSDKLKSYAGQASIKVRPDSKFTEGKSGLVRVTGTLRQRIEEYKRGFQSFLSYMNSSSLENFTLLDEEELVLLSSSSKLERQSFL